MIVIFDEARVNPSPVALEKSAPHQLSNPSPADLHFIVAPMRLGHGDRSYWALSIKKATPAGAAIVSKKHL